MSVTVHVDPSLMPGHTPTVVSGSTLTARQALQKLAQSSPVGPRLFNCDGELRSVFRILRGDQQVSPEEPLQDGDELIVSLR